MDWRNGLKGEKAAGLIMVTKLIFHNFYTIAQVTELPTVGIALEKKKYRLCGFSCIDYLYPYGERLLSIVHKRGECRERLIERELAKIQEFFSSDTSLSAQGHSVGGMLDSSGFLKQLERKLYFMSILWFSCNLEIKARLHGFSVLKRKYLLANKCIWQHHSACSSFLSATCQLGCFGTHV